MTGEQEPTGSRVYADLGYFKLTEFQAWLIQRGLTVVLILVFAFMLTPAVWQDYKAKKALEKDLEEMGCQAVFNQGGNFSIEGQKSQEQLFNIYNQTKIEPEEERPPHPPNVEGD